jgi:hypothetical protein
MQLSERIASLFKSGPAVHFTTKPSALILNAPQAIRIKAIFYLNPSLPVAKLEPVVKCKEFPSFFVALAEDSDPKVPIRKFYGEAKITPESSGSLTLLLAADTSAFPIAETVLHVFDESEITEADKELPHD